MSTTAEQYWSNIPDTTRGDERPPRTKDGRPLVMRPGGTTRKAYSRPSGYGDRLDDQTTLVMWKQRMTAIGVAGSRSLTLEVNAHRDDKDELNKIVKKAMTAAQADERASIGTSLHKINEKMDLGVDPGFIPEEWEADVAAYRQLTEPLFRHVAVEQFIVCDEIEVAGTTDRISELLRPLEAPDGTIIPAGAGLIVDQKTSGRLDFGQIKFSVQLAVYGNGVPYNVDTDEREDWPITIRKDWGLIVWTPAGEGIAELHWVDLVRGWDLAKLSRKVRTSGWRKRELVQHCPVEPHVAPVVNLDEVTDVKELTVRYRQLVRRGQWTDETKEQFAARRRELEVAA